MGEMAKVEPAPLAKSDWKELAKTAEVNPLLLIPAECRLAVTRLWMCNSHVLPSSLALCSTVRVYLDEHSLSPSDLERIVSRMLEPWRRAEQRGSWDVMADFSALIAEVVDRNKNRAEARERREEVTQITGTLFKPEG